MEKKKSKERETYRADKKPLNLTISYESRVKLKRKSLILGASQSEIVDKLIKDM